MFMIHHLRLFEGELTTILSIPLVYFLFSSLQNVGQLIIHHYLLEDSRLNYPRPYLRISNVIRKKTRKQRIKKKLFFFTSSHVGAYHPQPLETTATRGRHRGRRHHRAGDCAGPAATQHLGPHVRAVARIPGARRGGGLHRTGFALRFLHRCRRLQRSSASRSRTHAIQLAPNDQDTTEGYDKGNVPWLAWPAARHVATRAARGSE